MMRHWHVCGVLANVPNKFAYGAQAKRHAGTLERIRKGAARREKEAADQAEELKRQIRQLQRERELVEELQKLARRSYQMAW